MKNEENFYDIISSKFDDREIPFDKESWKSMQAMLDTSRAEKKRTLWLIASLSLLLCAGGVFALYKWNSKNGKSNTIALIKSANTSLKMAALNNNHNTNLSHTQNRIPGLKITINNRQLTNENIVKKGPASNQVYPSQIVANNSVGQKSFIKHAGHNSKLSSRGVTVANNIPFNDKWQNKVAQTVAEQNNLTIGQKKPISIPMVTQKAYPVSSSFIANALAAKNAAHKADSAAMANELPKRFSDEPRIFRGKTNIFSVEAGTEYSFGWQIGSVVQGRGFNPFIGMGYAHYLGSKLFLKTGMQFSTFGNMNTLTYNYQHSVGNVIYDSVIATKRLYFLRIPLQMEYSIGDKKKSSIGLGGSVWFLLGNSGFATTSQQVDNNPPVNVVKYSQNASLNGYSKVNASVHVLYRYIINHNFSVYGIWYFEATNMKNNSFFGDGIIQRTNGPQCTLSYNFN